MVSRKYSTYLFDLDGTLIDSIELIMESFRHTFRINLGAGPTPDQERRWREGFGTPLRIQLAKFVSVDQVDDLVDGYRTFTHEHHDRLIRPYSGISEALLALQRSGVRMSIVTSKTNQLARRGLQLFDLEDYFETVVGMDDVSEHKPHPAPVIEALSRMSVEASNVVFVGDSPHDICAGRDAGVGTAAVVWGPFKKTAFVNAVPDYWLSKPGELLNLRC